MAIAESTISANVKAAGIIKNFIPLIFISLAALLTILTSKIYISKTINF